MAHSVSRGVLHGVMGSSEKRPSQRRPARIRSLEAESGKEVLEVMAAMRSGSEGEAALRIFCVVDFQVGGREVGFRKGFSSAERKLMSTRTRIN